MNWRVTDPHMKWDRCNFALWTEIFGWVLASPNFLIYVLSLRFHLLISFFIFHVSFFILHSSFFIFIFIFQEPPNTVYREEAKNELWNQERSRFVQKLKLLRREMSSKTRNPAGCFCKILFPEWSQCIVILRDAGYCTGSIHHIVLQGATCLRKQRLDKSSSSNVTADFASHPTFRYEAKHSVCTKQGHWNNTKVTEERLLFYFRFATTRGYRFHTCCDRVDTKIWEGNGHIFQTFEGKDNLPPWTNQRWAFLCSYISAAFSWIWGSWPPSLHVH